MTDEESDCLKALKATQRFVSGTKRLASITNDAQYAISNGLTERVHDLQKESEIIVKDIRDDAYFLKNALWLDNLPSIASRIEDRMNNLYKMTPEQITIIADADQWDTKIRALNNEAYSVANDCLRAIIDKEMCACKKEYPVGSRMHPFGE